MNYGVNELLFLEKRERGGGEGAVRVRRRLEIRLEVFSISPRVDELRGSIGL